jgi:hypothetical protein
MIREGGVTYQAVKACTLILKLEHLRLQLSQILQSLDFSQLQIRLVSCSSKNQNRSGP